MWHTLRLYQGRIQDFKLGGGGVNIKKLRRAKGSAKILGYYVWKITILHQKIIFFSNFRGGGGGREPGAPPGSAPVYLGGLVTARFGKWHALWLYLDGLITARFGQCGIQSDYTLMVLSQHDGQWHTLWLYLDGLITARFGHCGIHSDYTLMVLSQHDLVSAMHSDYTLMVLSQHDLVSVAYTLIIPWWSYHGMIWSVWHTLWLYLGGLITARLVSVVHFYYTGI